MRLSNRTKRLLLAAFIISSALIGFLCIGLIRDVIGVYIGCPFLAIAVIVSIYTFLFPIVDKPPSLQEKIDVMNLNKYKEKFKFNDCLICKNSKQYMVKFDCDHYFCNDCVYKTNIEKCPTCRSYIDPFAITYYLNEI